ncbi:hypothetical protein [Comamonas sp. B-9]|uniref:hypothetical protein n=1 Tax=Comamonas sp. B-9 TaxID=1055192 RepID=UPI0011DD0CB7|nr:hypothetical protein [Comamonas sp. B-9]
MNNHTLAKPFHRHNTATELQRQTTLYWTTSKISVPMHPLLGHSLLLSGIALAILAQLGMAIFVFRSQPLKFLLCLLVPFYIVVCAQKTPTGKRFLASWYAGIAIFAMGGVLSS